MDFPVPLPRLKTGWKRVDRIRLHPDGSRGRFSGDGKPTEDQELIALPVEDVDVTLPAGHVHGRDEAGVRQHFVTE
jgi:hypothetical protein